MRCKNLFARMAVLTIATPFVTGLTPLPDGMPGPALVLKAQSTETQPAQQSSTPEQGAAPAIAPERPLTPEEQKAADARLHFDRVLVDAAVLLNEFEESRRGRGKSNISMSSFRNLEIQLNAIADADPSNDQARDWAKKMQQAQFEILQPSVAVADVASRQLYADTMSAKLRDQAIGVSVMGPGARIVAFVAPQMTKEMGAKLAESAKIYDQARRLQFEKVVFSNSRRGWMYDLRTGRYR